MKDNLHIIAWDKGSLILNMLISVPLSWNNWLRHLIPRHIQSIILGQNKLIKKSNSLHH